MFEVKNLTVARQNKKILSDISFKITKSQVVVVIGPSAAGKTTLLRAISGLLECQGKIIYDARDIKNTSVHKRNFAYVTQEQTLFPHMTVFENIAFPLKVRHVKKNEIEKKVTELMRKFNIEKLSQRNPGRLSGGEYQKAAIARSFIYNPDLILMDEPFAQLDPQSKYTLINWLSGQLRTRKVSTLYVTHYLNEAMSLADKIIFLCRGKMIFFGKPQELKKSTNPEILNYLKKTI